MSPLPTKKRALLRALASDSDGENGNWHNAGEITELLSSHGKLRYAARKAVDDLERDDQSSADEDDRATTCRLRSGPDLGVSEIRQMLDELAQSGFLERQDTPAIQYGRVRAPMPWPVEEVRQIADSRSAQLVVSGYAEEGVVLVDKITASLLIKIYDKLSVTNQQKFAGRDVIEATNLAWKLVEKGAVSMSFH